MTEVVTRPLPLNDFEAAALAAGIKSTFRRRVQLPRGGWEYAEALGLGKITSKHPKAGRFGAFIQRTDERVRDANTETDLVVCPFGQPGDRLWVRESYRMIPDYDEPAGYSGVLYKADYGPDSGKWKSCVLMPRELSRALLEVVEVRVERLQHISIGQICKEGLARSMYEFIPVTTAFDAYADYWNTAGGNWDANPWVWVVEFRRVTP